MRDRYSLISKHTRKYWNFTSICICYKCTKFPLSVLVNTIRRCLILILLMRCSFIVCVCVCVTACNVWYLGSVSLESLTGHQAVQKATTQTLSMDPPPASTVVHFKVSAQGITLTDNQRKWVFIHAQSKHTHTGGNVIPWESICSHTRCLCHCRLFFRRHYAVNTVIFCSLDPQGRKWVSGLQEEVKDAKKEHFHPGCVVLLLCYILKQNRKKTLTVIVTVFFFFLVTIYTKVLLHMQLRNILARSYCWRTEALL